MSDLVGNPDAGFSHVVALMLQIVLLGPSLKLSGVHWPSGRVQLYGARGLGFDTYPLPYELRRKKAGPRGFRPGRAQTGLQSLKMAKSLKFQI